jgi:ATP-dependent RNA helicase RhlE
MSFNSLGLSAELLRAIEEQGYTEPTPIQTQAIPLILQGKDVMGGAQTGTGKTAGFTLPLLQHLMTGPKSPGKRPVRALVLTPTRELASQVECFWRSQDQSTNYQAARWRGYPRRYARAFAGSCRPRHR